MASPVCGGSIGRPGGEGTTMRIGLSFQRTAAGRLGQGGFYASLLLSVIAIAGIAAWFMLPEPSDAGDQELWPISPAVIRTTQYTSTEAEPAQPAKAAPTAPADEPATVGMATAPQAVEAAKPSEQGAERSPLEKLRIASQSWRRGGLGSKALVTLTLRNANDFAVKDIEIACAFIRRDGSPLTERKRLISDTIAMKSRKTYSRMLIGFVNVNANKAKCSVVTASRV
ncbi:MULTISPECIES: hypothetical protein [unclassified Bradyrhizobium]|uniref:hypothetical protein n=1 Tax=unclassified Bradyrhizobium TaxID=2631580 RepID=UPI0012EC2ABB|nr:MULTISPECIES: hypothetical protein [unclassified Bradyrhizobium]QIG92675.1 hypothetical protein G6P99_09280 [Bradyrhizobium sp. 6(2017)]